MKDQNLQNNKGHNDKGVLQHYTRWSGLAFQMIALVLMGYFAGKKTDQLIESSYSWFTLGFLLLSVIGSMLLAIRSIQKDSKNHNKGEPKDGDQFKKTPHQ